MKIYRSYKEAKEEHPYINKSNFKIDKDTYWVFSEDENYRGFLEGNEYIDKVLLDKKKENIKIKYINLFGITDFSFINEMLLKHKKDKHYLIGNELVCDLSENGLWVFDLEQFKYVNKDCNNIIKFLKPIRLNEGSIDKIIEKFMIF